MKLLRPLGIVLLACGLSAGARAADLVNGIRAIVHDSIITQQDVQEKTAPAAGVLQRQYPGKIEVIMEKLAKAERDNLQELMERQLILHDFQTSGFSLPDSVVDDVVQDRIRARYSDQRTFTKTLQAEGITKETFRKRLRDSVVLELMRQKNVSSALIISPQKVENYYEANKGEFKVEERVKVEMIVLNREGAGAVPNPDALAQEILVKIKDGTPFTELASMYSQRAQTIGGGEWHKRGALRPEINAAIANLKPGETSGVVQTADAYYLVKINEAEADHFKPLNEVRPTIENTLLLQERARLEKQWVARLKKKTFTREF